MRIAWIPILGALAFLPGGARADIPPADGYVETCTLEEMQRDGAQCVACSTGVVEGETPCGEQPQTEGRTECCQTFGASFWTEIWCTETCPTQRPSPVPPLAEADGGGSCDCRAAGGPVSGGAAGLALASALLLWLRRRCGPPSA